MVSCRNLICWRIKKSILSSNLKSRSEKLHGVILKRSNFNESDKIITIFTKEYGKIRSLAKGVRKIKSRRAPHLELFNQVEIYIHHGQTFDLITEAATIENYSGLKKELKLSGYLFYISEILDRILPENQPHEEVYLALLSCVHDLLIVILGSVATPESPKPGTGAILDAVRWSPDLTRMTEEKYKQAQDRVKQFIVQLLWNLGYLPHGQYPKQGITTFVEEIIEKPIKSKKFLEEI